MAEENSMIFRFNDNSQGPELVHQVFLERGWIEFDEDVHHEQEWNLWWKASRFRASDYEHLLPWQRLNHIPKTTALTKKDSLSRNLKRMKGIYGAGVYNFNPLSYNLPNDYKRFVADYTKWKQKDPEKLQLWICKPADLSRGRGIFIFRDLSDLQYDCSAVVQKYIINPLLIAGYKFDLRVYVCVTSFHPLGIYIYQEGIVRFSTEKFDLTNLSNVFSHLTNTSINKFGPSYTADKERLGPGCKWSITQLRHYFRQNGIDDRLMFCRITCLVILTILAQANQVPKATNCYELYGFDIIIDENLKPWLLEVNFSPALGIDCATDITTKKPMVHDLIDMLNFAPEDCERGGKNFKFTPNNKPIDYFRAAQRASNRQPKFRHVQSRLKMKPEKLTQNSMEPDSGDESPVELVVPGCGLPSVQMKSRQSMSSSSGCSSAGSNNVSNSANLQNLRQNSGASNMSKGQDSSNPKCIKENSQLSLKKEQTRYVKENSAVSDSAVSGLSSENSDIGAESENFAQQTFPDQKEKLFTKSVSAMQSCYDRHIILSTPAPASKSDTTNKIRSQTTGAENNRARKLSEPTPLVMNRPVLHRQNTQPVFSSMNRSGFKPKQTLLPHRQKLSNTLSSSNFSMPHKSFNDSRTDASNPFQTKQGYPMLQPRFGDYFLVFPFNEAMRRMKENLDIRASVREVQRLLKSKINEVKGIGKEEKVSDVPQLWGPVRGPDDVPDDVAFGAGMKTSSHM